MSANRRLILKIGAVLKSMGCFCIVFSLWDGDLTFNIEVGGSIERVSGPAGFGRKEGSFRERVIFILFPSMQHQLAIDKIRP